MSVAAIANTSTVLARTTIAALAANPVVTKVKIVGSRIIEAKNFQSIEQYMTEGTLGLLDIDNTQIKPRQTMGSDQWFRHRVTVRNQENPTKPQDAIDLALMDWYAVQNLTEAVAVEESTPACIAKLQDEGHMLMGFTTRSASLAMPTHRQLTSVGIDLTRTSPQIEQVVFLNPHEVKYRHGALYTSGTDKGEAFDKFLSHITDVFPRDKVQSVLFINDREADLVQLQRKVDALGIPYLGVRYSFMDEEVKQSDMVEADRQFEQLRAVFNK